jgi:hypothetical protein
MDRASTMSGEPELSERNEILAAAILRQAERSRAWLVGSVVTEPCGGKGANKKAAAAKRKRKGRGRPKMKRVLSPIQAVAAAKRRRAYVRGL